MRQPSGPDAVVLMGHGSRDPAAATEFLALSEALGAAPELAQIPVVPGWLEFAGDPIPTIQAAFDQCIAAGARRIVAVPAILFAAGHGTEDMPAQVQLAQARYPQADIRQADLVGIDDVLLECLAARAQAATAALACVPPSATALLLVTSGSSNREANADVFKAARLLADHTDVVAVEVAFLRLARPFLQDAIRRCAQLGAQRVVVLPLFLNTGLLARRIPRKLVWLRRDFPDLELLEVPHLGVDQRLVGVLVERALAACRAVEPHPPHQRTPVYLAPGHEWTRPHSAHTEVSA
jgi:sirohydrochlorin cobaltochelatase